MQESMVYRAFRYLIGVWCSFFVMCANNPLSAARLVTGVEYRPGEDPAQRVKPDVSEQALNRQGFSFVSEAAPETATSLRTTLFDNLRVKNSGKTAGWIELQVKPSTDGGWDGYVLIANKNDPRKRFYFGSIYQTRTLNFQGPGEIVCYICNGTTNCDPNRADPRCTGPDTGYAISCKQRVSCSRVLRVNQCFTEIDSKQFAAQAPQWYHNDLGLCASFPKGLTDYSGGSTDSFQAQQDVGPASDLEKQQQPQLHQSVQGPSTNSPYGMLLNRPADVATVAPAGGAIINTR